MQHLAPPEARQSVRRDEEAWLSGSEVVFLAVLTKWHKISVAYLYI